MLYHYDVLHNLANCYLLHLPERSVRTVRILVTSSKGGIGKSTLSVGLAVAFAKMGRRVLLCDCDLGGRCLDMLLGEENNVLFDISDVASGRTDGKSALINPWETENLFFCPAPAVYDPEDFKDGALMRALRDLEAACSADHVICDTAGTVFAPDIAGGFAETALVVSTQQPASVRAAETTAVILSERGLTDSRLIINMFEWQSAEKGIRSGIIDMIDGAGIRCEGIVPYSRSLMLAGEAGRPVSERIPVMQAFKNIAARLEGDTVKLFTGIPKAVSRKIL
ncbi:MAG: septum site-determining protein MinD [Ruminococcaceae bacterium]|nr:septum site-determining protein MinD [Oscillospiraceae bacterium]